jgi:FolB domain-containing protein
LSPDKDCELNSTFRKDRLTIVGVKLQPCIGVTQGERRLPQACEADVTVWGNFEAAASRDSLDETVDYSKILATVVEVAHAQEYNLLETLAYRIARKVLQSYPAQCVAVKVRKRPMSLAGRIESIEVQVETSRVEQAAVRGGRES